MIYLDNAASGWPKPPEALQAMAHYMEHASANPGRSGHRMALEAARIVYQARENVAALLGVRDPLRIVFAANATEALNLALAGLLRPGDHVITSSLEHNAVMRPLRALEARGVAVSVVHCSPEGLLDPRAVEAAIRPTTRLIALVHASNVVGTLLPIAEVGRIARRYDLLFLVDAAQTAGACPIDLDAAAIDLLAFTGHKALLGPQGTGGLYIGPRVSLDELRPLVHGGTGSRSEEELQPDFLPDRYESGTLNGVGLAGLAAGVQRLLEEGVATVRAHEVALTRQLLAGLARMPRVTVYGTGDAERQIATVSFNVAGMAPSEVGLRLDEEHAILCRVGLHCSPAAHRTIGTYPAGTVRWSLGRFNTLAEVDQALNALEALARAYSRTVGSS
ncbi:MAG TPA: aminotransferase class V-fold PLP-dependent enzyme [Anaerolineae bacterium]|nr:aminotransferase class V-fold PLP-dependent enzyme [Anaerolineae bacterium]HOR00487.1 aminotransferase class V-fold PLP-dependent enzyme [Anaerolineae bacterium]